MSKAITAIMNITAKPSGLDKFSFVSVGATANPVIEGLINKKLIRKIAETMFNTNVDVLMLFIDICEPGFILFVFSLYNIHKYVL